MYMYKMYVRMCIMYASWITSCVMSILNYSCIGSSTIMK